MIKPFFEYPKIKHFKEVMGYVFKHARDTGEQVELEFHGTVKLHGTNFSVVYDVNADDVYFQKRSDVLLKTTTFFNYQEVVYGVIEELKELGRIYSKYLPDSRYIVMFGELVGQEIQRGVALEQLSKRFVIFDVFTELKTRLTREQLKEGFNSHDPINNIYCIENFKTFDIKVNVFNSSEIHNIQNELARITEEVEKECPFASQFGVLGVGEGVVWTNDRFNAKFKVKGEEHTNSKVKVLTGVSQDKIDMLKSIEEVCEAICTESRFKQGFSYLMENNISVEQSKQTYLKWVVEDTITEEMDIIVEKGLDVAKVKGTLYKNALNYFVMNKGKYYE